MSNELPKKENILREKSYAFAIRIVKLAQHLNNEKHEHIISNQILRSGTAIGALVRESEFGQSKADFISKLSIALKEANETDYWLSLLKDSSYLSENEFNSISPECTELIKLLISSINTAKNNNKK
ncbi:MAG TPA: four helix bundle protein [Bacteroidales bacterium]|nr:four helix bundle protein [Bacteroidales bacterium]